MSEDQLCKLEETVSQWPGGMTDNCIVQELLSTIREHQKQLAPPPAGAEKCCSTCAYWHTDSAIVQPEMALCQRQTRDAMRWVLTHKDRIPCDQWSTKDV